MVLCRIKRMGEGGLRGATAPVIHHSGSPHNRACPASSNFASTYTHWAAVNYTESEQSSEGRAMIERPLCSVEVEPWSQTDAPAKSVHREVHLRSSSCTGGPQSLT